MGDAAGGAAGGGPAGLFAAPAALQPRPARPHALATPSTSLHPCPQIPDKLLIDAMGGPAAVKAAAAEVVLKRALPAALAPRSARAVSGSETMQRAPCSLATCNTVSPTVPAP